MSTRRRATSVTVAVLAGVLVLGACGTERSGPEQAARDGARAEAVQAEAVEAEARAAAVRLQQLRLRYPTAGTEVPPADLVRTGTAGRTSTIVRPTLLHRYVQ